MEATTGIEPVITLLQRVALTTWLRGHKINNNFLVLSLCEGSLKERQTDALGRLSPRGGSPTERATRPDIFKSYLKLTIFSSKKGGDCPPIKKQ